MSVISTFAKRATVSVVAAGTLTAGLVAVASPASAYVCTAALANDTSVSRGGSDHAYTRDCEHGGLVSVLINNSYKVKKVVRENGKKRVIIVTKQETLTLDTYRDDAAGNGDDAFRIPVYDGNGHLITLGEHVVNVYAARSFPAAHRFSVTVTR